MVKKKSMVRRGSHGEEEVNCRVGRNDRQGNDVTEYEVDREKSQKEEESPR